jgi:hypothetical protein
MQIKLPAKLAREMRVQAGDQFHWRRSDDDPGVLLLIPDEVVERRYEHGRSQELSPEPNPRTSLQTDGGG